VASGSGSEQTTDINVAVKLSAASSQEVRVSYFTNNGTATSSNDYVFSSGTLIFAPGETSKNIPIRIISDSVSEPDETFDVFLWTPVNGTLGTSKYTYTISNP
jgi:hypothetical protein